MEQFQRDQQQLQQYYQQQRIMELQMARQRQMEMEAQNVGRFTQMRERALGAIAAPPGAFVASELGFMGRNIGVAAPGQAARQSIFGAMVDARAARLQGSMLFRTAGFQFNARTEEVQQRAARELGVFQRQIPNVMMDAIIPTMFQRELGIVGRGDIRERSVEMMDTFAGLRGQAANVVTGRGMNRGRAERVTERLNDLLNQEFEGKLDREQIGDLQRMSQQVLTGSDLVKMSQGSEEKQAQTQADIVKVLNQIATNTGASNDELKQISADATRNGKTLQDVAALATMVDRPGNATTTISRERMLRLGQGFMDQGTMMGMIDPLNFAQQNLQSVNDLLQIQQAGGISRRNLYRYGGENDEDAASRVQQRRIQSSQQFVQENMATVGILGAQRTRDALDEGGIMGMLGATAEEIAQNPLAGVLAPFARQRQQRILQTAPRLARRIAEDTARLKYQGFEYSDEEFEQLTASEFGTLMGLSPTEALDELERLKGVDTAITRNVAEYARAAESSSLPSLSEEQQDAIATKMREELDIFQNLGLNLQEVSQGLALSYAVDPDKNPYARAAEFKTNITGMRQQDDLVESLTAKLPGGEANERYLRDTGQYDPAIKLLPFEEAMDAFGLEFDRLPEKPNESTATGEEFRAYYDALEESTSYRFNRREGSENLLTKRSYDLRRELQFSATLTRENLGRFLVENDLLTDNVLEQALLYERADGSSEYKTKEEIMEALKTKEGQAAFGDAFVTGAEPGTTAYNTGNRAAEALITFALGQLDRGMTRTNMASQDRGTVATPMIVEDVNAAKKRRP